MSRQRGGAVLAAVATTPAAFGALLPLMVATSPAYAAAAPKQSVLNDWGQTAAQVNAEILTAVNADPLVIAARARLATAQTRHAAAKRAETAARQALAKTALTPTKADDKRALVAMNAAIRVSQKAFVELRFAEVAATRTISAARTRITDSHFVEAPAVAIPAAPAVSTSADGNQVVVSWFPVSGATRYAVIRDGYEVAETTGTDWVDSGLSYDTVPSYEVVAKNIAGWSPSSSPANVAISVRPAANLVSAPGDSHVLLTWTGITGATAYEVRRDGQSIASVTTTSYDDTGLVNGAAHTWSVIAKVDDHASPTGPEITDSAVAPPLTTPTNVTATPGDSSAVLTWAPVTGALSYRIVSGSQTLATVTENTYTATGLVNGVTYSFSVIAVRGSDTSSPTTVNVTPVAPVAGTPTGLSATAQDAAVSLSWSAVSQATSYRVYVNGQQSTITTAPNVIITSLANGTQYSFTVSAVSGSTVSTPSSPVVATPVATTPTAPTNLVLTPGNGQLTLSWTAPARATSYGVYRNNVLVGSPTTASYVDTGLTNGSSYAYRVVAFAQNSVASPAATGSATPAKPLVSGTFVGASAKIASNHGTIQVTVTLTNSVITSASSVLLTNDGSETRSINSRALPKYNSEAVAANSVTIASVSGASLTWTAYKTSLQSALTQSGR